MEEIMPQGIAPGNSWLGGVSSKDYKIVINGLQDLWRRENQYFSELTRYNWSSGQDPDRQILY